ncbi:MAG: type II toxin-antitoxin system HipA family toxin, partial [Candidatus Electrothrix sp. AR4]|nr:type II toxin-antitoxin system HipA family toxin [Candidatus Electrothrix sp. AR4]
MKAEINLYVHAVFPDSQIIEVGRLLVRNLLSYENQEGFFRYAPSFLNHPLAYPIDPVHFPLTQQTFPANRKTSGIHHLFDDSLPDAWGRHILARKGNLEQQRFAPAHLLAILQGSGLGRFLYTENQGKPDFKDNSIDFKKIVQAVDEAGKLEEGLDVKTIELQHLLACGSSAGGARPKVLTRRNEQLWIAKLASRKDPHPNLLPALEEAGMTLSSLAGLHIPEIERVAFDSRDMFLIRRFDVTESGGRNALVSFRTLLGMDDHYAASYSDMAGLLRTFSFRPTEDAEQLFRQMAVNVILVNTDDHLQNFAMVHTENGWSLSPAYDIVPNIYQTSQIVMINHKHKDIEASDLIAEGKRFGLSVQRCKRLLEETVDALSRWPNVFVDCKVPEAHTGRLRMEITQRLRSISNALLPDGKNIRHDFLPMETEPSHNVTKGTLPEIQTPIDKNGIEPDTSALEDIKQRLLQSELTLDTLTTKPFQDNEEPELVGWKEKKETNASEKQKKETIVLSRSTKKAWTKIPVKSILAVGALLVLIISSIFIYKRDINLLTKSEFNWKAARRLARQQQFKKAEIKAKRALAGLKTILTPGIGKVELQKNIISLLNATYFQKGVSGEAKYKGQYLPIKEVKKLQEVDKLIAAAETLLQTEKINRAISASEKTQEFAEKNILEEHATTL